MKNSSSKGEPPSELIDARIRELGDWRGKTLSRLRTLIKQADPEVVEEVKWRKPSNSMLGVPVWSHDGIICTGETYRDKVKLTFAKGASIEDPTGLFNSSLDGNTRRAIDVHEGEKIDGEALKALVRAAVALNRWRAASRELGLQVGQGSPSSPPARSRQPPARQHASVVEAKEVASRRPTTIAEYIRAAPREGRPHLRRLYAILKGVAPEAEEAIKWGTPFFVEPRFLFAFSAHKAHLDFSPTAAGLEPFRKELEEHQTTKGMLQIPYDKPLPESLVRKIAEQRLRDVREREDDAFW